MRTRIHWMIPVAVVAMLLGPAVTTADVLPPDTAGDDDIALYFSNGEPPALGITNVNQRLGEIGVHVTRVAIPTVAKPILRQSRERALSPAESQALIRHFPLGRQELLDVIRVAGRKPAAPRGGRLQTAEQGVPPYPKVYDMRALDAQTTTFLQRKFGRLHVNSSDAGIGIDEVMTIASGGPYTWFFVFADDVVGKLRFGEVGENGPAWRISYPGLVPHGGYFDAPHGIVVAYAHGPKTFVMRYAAAGTPGHRTLGDNPWIDFTQHEPALLSEPDAATTASAAR